MIDIKIKLEEGVSIPVYAKDGDAGFDLHCNKVLKLYKGNQEIDLKDKLKNTNENGYFHLRPGERVLLGTGIFMELPKGYELQIRSRSGSTLKRGLVVANSPGTVDSGYRGEIGIIIINTTPFLSKIELGEAIAQGVIKEVEQANFIVTETLTTSERGEGGFGHTNEIKPIFNDLEDLKL